MIFNQIATEAHFQQLLFQCNILQIYCFTKKIKSTVPFTNHRFLKLPVKDLGGILHWRLLLSFFVVNSGYFC